MKQPVITRDLERKAIYTDIMCDPEWTYLEFDAYRSYSKYVDFHLSSPVIIDWGDGTIDDKSTHYYDGRPNQSQLIVRIKGDIKPDKPDRENGTFGY